MPAFRGPDGKIVYASDEDAGRFEAGGYERVGEATAGAAQNRIAPVDNGIVGSIGATLSAGLSGATLGASDWLLKGVLDKGGFEQMAQDRADNPGLSGAAQFAGAFLPAVVSGGSVTPSGYLSHLAAEGIGSAEAVGGAAGAVKSLAIAGSEGAIQNAGVYLSDVALGDRDLTAEGVYGALGTGFAFGGGGLIAGHGLVAGTTAARRMFARYASGGEEAALAAKSAWQEQSAKALESFDQAATTAEAKLQEAQLVRQQADLARKRASAAVAEAKIAPPPPETAMAGAGVEVATPGAAPTVSPEIEIAGLMRDRAMAATDPARMAAWDAQNGQRLQELMAARMNGAMPADPLEAMAQMPGVQRTGPETAVRQGAYQPLPGQHAVTPEEAELAAKLSEYRAARDAFHDTHASVDPELDDVLRGSLGGDVQREPVPVGEFGAPGARGYDPGNVREPGPPSQAPLANAPEGTPVTRALRKPTAPGEPTTAFDFKDSGLTFDPETRSYLTKEPAAGSDLPLGLPDKAKIGGRYSPAAPTIEPAKATGREPTIEGANISDLKSPNETDEHFVLRRMRQQGVSPGDVWRGNERWLGSLGIDWAVPENKHVLLSMLQSGKARISRLDLVDMFDDATVANSEITDHLGEQFHFIHDDGQHVEMPKHAQATPRGGATNKDLEQLIADTEKRFGKPTPAAEVKDENFSVKRKGTELPMQMTAKERVRGDGTKITEISVEHIPGDGGDTVPVGVAEFEHRGNGELYPLLVSVDDDFQRLGIATRMYDRAEAATGRSIVNANDQTPEGAAFRAARSERKSASSQPTDTLTGLLRGTKSKIDAGESLVEMGAPARAAYATAKAARTKEAAGHFRAKAPGDLRIATTANPNSVGTQSRYVIEASSGGKSVGVIRLGTDDGGNYLVNNVLVLANNRRLGIGTRLYEAAAEQAERDGVTLLSGRSTSDEAAGVWKKLVQSGRAEEYAPGRFKMIRSGRPDVTADVLSHRSEMTGTGLAHQPPKVADAAAEAPRAAKVARSAAASESDALLAHIRATDPDTAELIDNFAPRAARREYHIREIADGACDTAEPDFNPGFLRTRRFDMSSDEGMAEIQRLYHMTDEQVAAAKAENLRRMKELGIPSKDFFHQVSVTKDGIVIDWTANQFNDLPMPYVFRLKPVAAAQASTGSSDFQPIPEHDYIAHRKSFEAKLGPDERKAIDTYTSTTYKDINRALRHEEIRNGREGFISKIDEALAKSPLRDNAKLYRGLSGDEAKQFRSLEVGDTFEEKAFTSTSSSPDAFKREVNLHIDVPAGYEAAPVPSSIDEKEWLLRRNTRFEVTGIQDHGATRTINVRVVDSPPPRPVEEMASTKTGRLPDAPPVAIVKGARDASEGGDLMAALQGTKQGLDSGKGLREIAGHAPAEHPLAMKQLELAHDDALERAAAAKEPAEKAAAQAEARAIEQQMTAVGKKPGAVEDVAVMAPAVHRLEKAAAELTEALGPEAPAAAQAHAKAFRDAEDTATQKSVSRAARAADDHASAQERAQADDLVNGPSARERAVAAAKRQRAEAEAAYQRAQVAEAEASIGAKQAKRAATEARKNLPPPPPGAPAPTGKSIGGRIVSGAHAIGYAAELGSDVGIPGIPRPHDIPVIGPLLSAYLKYRAFRAAAGRFMGRIPATAETKAAELAARTRDGIARSMDRSLGLIERNPNAVRTGLTLGAIRASEALSKRLIDDGHPDAPSGASVSQLAAVRMREVASAVANPTLISDMVRQQTRNVVDPDLITALENHLTAMFAHLNDTAPKGPPPNPLAKQDWKPPAAAAVQWGQRLAVAQSPQVAFDLLEAGKLTPSAADTLRVCYQKLFAEAQARLAQRAADLENPVPYRQLMQAGLLFDTPTHASLDPENATVLQQAHVAPPQPAPQPTAPPVPGVAAPTNVNALYQTTADRRAAR